MGSIVKLHGTCPVCGTGGQPLPVLKSLSRSCFLTCSRCETPLYSDIGWIKYLLFMLYGQIVVMLTGLPLIYFLIGGNWIMAALAASALLALLILPGMALHAGEIRTRFDL